MSSLIEKSLWIKAFACGKLATNTDVIITDTVSKSNAILLDIDFASLTVYKRFMNQSSAKNLKINIIKKQISIIRKMDFA